MSAVTYVPLYQVSVNDYSSVLTATRNIFCQHEKKTRCMYATG